MFCPLRGAKNRCQLMGYSGMNSIFWRPCTLSFQHFRTERWSVIERPTDSTTGTTSGQTDTTSVQTSTTSGRKCTTNGQTNRQATTMSEKRVLQVDKRVLQVVKRVLWVTRRVLQVLRATRRSLQKLLPWTNVLFNVRV